MPFMDPETLLKTMSSILSFRIFCGSMTVCFVICFILLMLINKKNKWKNNKGRDWGRGGGGGCCCTVVVMLSSFLYHPPSGQCSGNEVQRVSQVILQFWWCLCVCVYMCIYIHAHLHSITAFHPHGQKYPAHVRSVIPSFLSHLCILTPEYNVLVHPPWDKMSVKEHTKFEINISDMSNAFSCLFKITHCFFFLNHSVGLYLLKMIIKVYCEICIQVCGIWNFFFLFCSM